MAAVNACARPVIRYHGGKWKLAPWIIGHFPAHRIYVEPFGGGASVLMRKNRSYAEVYNDKWGDVVNVFQVLRDHGNKLTEQLYLTPFSRAEFDKCQQELEDPLDPIERARRTIYRSFSGFGSASVNGQHATGFRANSNRSGSTPAHDWMNYPDHIQAFIDRLRGVVIENRDAWDVIQQHDSPETLHYLDPPYMHETRNMARGNSSYAAEIHDEDHEQLLANIQGLQGMVVISGYRSDLYDDALADWARIDKSTFADGANPRVESIWLNPAAEGHGQQPLGL